MVCPPAAVEAADEKSHWIRNTCFGGFVTVVSDGSGRHRSRAVARLEGISKYDTEGKESNKGLQALLSREETVA